MSVMEPWSYNQGQSKIYSEVKDQRLVYSVTLEGKQVISIRTNR